jgi:hypothetical protein
VCTTVTDVEIMGAGDSDSDPYEQGELGKRGILRALTRSAFDEMETYVYMER